MPQERQVWVVGDEWVVVDVEPVDMNEPTVEERVEEEKETVTMVIQHYHAL